MAFPLVLLHIYLSYITHISYLVLRNADVEIIDTLIYI